MTDLRALAELHASEPIVLAALYRPRKHEKPLTVVSGAPIVAAAELAVRAIGRKVKEKDANRTTLLRRWSTVLLGLSDTQLHVLVVRSGRDGWAFKEYLGSLPCQHLTCRILRGGLGGFEIEWPYSSRVVRLRPLYTTRDSVALERALLKGSQ